MQAMLPTDIPFLSYKYYDDLALFPDGGVSGEAVDSFTVNESPVSGSCRLNLENGTAMETEFTVHCYEWRDQVMELRD